jgi:hypothetical protein
MSGFSRSHFFSAVYIVQFLDVRDTQKTGAELHSYLEPIAQAAGVHLSFVDVATPRAFVEALKDIIAHCRATRAAAILHLETHATPAGVGLATNALISWAELAPLLTELNQLSEMNLLVTMAACHGFNLVRALRPGDESPVWGLLGPNDQVLPSDVRHGFRAFYSTLLGRLDLNAAIIELKNAPLSWVDAWRFQNAELFLAYIYGHYLATHTTDEEFRRREADIVAGLAQKGIADTPALRTSIRASLGDEEASFERIKRRFLMLDRFPHNEGRFGMTLTEVRRLHALLGESAERYVDAAG